MNIIELKRIVDRLYENTKEYNRESTTVGIEVKRIGSVCGTPLVNIKGIYCCFGILFDVTPT